MRRSGSRARSTQRVVPALLVALASAAAPAMGAAQAFTDPVGDFRPGYVASGNPNAPGLDVTGGAVYFNGSAFIFTATLAAAVDPAAAPASWAYVWGVNRGAGTARFAALGLNDILFDAVVIARPNGPDVVNLFTPAPGGATPLSASAVTFSGNTFSVVVPTSLLPSQGFAFADYTFNLWPRVAGTAPNTLPPGVVNASDAEIPDFAPDAVNVGIAAVPEPATILLLAPALVGLAVVRRRRAAR